MEGSNTRVLFVRNTHTPSFTLASSSPFSGGWWIFKEPPQQYNFSPVALVQSVPRFTRTFFFRSCSFSHHMIAAREYYVIHFKGKYSCRCRGFMVYTWCTQPYTVKKALLLSVGILVFVSSDVRGEIAGRRRCHGRSFCRSVSPS